MNTNSCFIYVGIGQVHLRPFEHRYVAQLDFGFTIQKGSKVVILYYTWCLATAAIHLASVGS